MFLAVTAHNVPEGLAVGFAFGRAQRAGGILSALWLAIGIGVQNFPEGAAVALPVKQELNSSKKAFLYGMASGAVEPVFAALGYFLAAHLTWIQPWALAFSAGAMIYVVAEELLPQAQTPLLRKVGAWGVMIGFLVMMTLDVAFG